MSTERDKAFSVFFLQEEYHFSFFPLSSLEVLVFKIYCAYLGALFSISSLVKAQCFSGLLQVEAGEEGLCSRKFWPFIQAKNCQRSLKIKSRNVFKIMARVCFFLWFFPFTEMTELFLLRNKQAKLFFEMKTKPGKYPLQDESLI